LHHPFGKKEFVGERIILSSTIKLYNTIYSQWFFVCKKYIYGFIRYVSVLDRIVEKC